jgi:hypothetical protein
LTRNVVALNLTGLLQIASLMDPYMHKVAPLLAKELEQPATLFSSLPAGSVARVLVNSTTTVFFTHAGTFFEMGLPRCRRQHTLLENAAKAENDALSDNTEVVVGSTVRPVRAGRIPMVPRGSSGFLPTLGPTVLGALIGVPFNLFAHVFCRHFATGCEPVFGRGPFQSLQGSEWRHKNLFGMLDAFAGDLAGARARLLCSGV